MLNDSVLVLNRSWIAIQVASARRAISLLYQGYAKVVSPEDFSTYNFDDWKELSREADAFCIHTVNFKIMVPEVIVLTYFNGVLRRDIKFSRRNRQEHLPVLREKVQEMGVYARPCRSTEQGWTFDLGESGTRVCAVQCKEGRPVTR